jgi:hypothetical protein
VQRAGTFFSAWDPGGLWGPGAGKGGWGNDERKEDEKKKGDREKDDDDDGFDRLIREIDADITVNVVCAGGNGIRIYHLPQGSTVADLRIMLNGDAGAPSHNWLTTTAGMKIADVTGGWGVGPNDLPGATYLVNHHRYYARARMFGNDP